MKPPKIKLIDASVGYMTETIIKNLSLEIEQGEMTGIFGPNGAGKTTLLCAVNGLARIPSGKVEIDGMEFTPLNENSLREKIGYVPQHFDIDPKLPVTAGEAVLMGSYGRLGLFNFPGIKERRMLEELGAMLGIKHLLKKPFGQLSGGEKKKMLIARALMQKPEIMLLDEMFAWLDSSTVNSFTETIKDVHVKNKLTTLIVSHDMKIIKKLCTRIIRMEKGRIIFDGRMEEVSKKLETGNGIN